MNKVIIAALALVFSTCVSASFTVEQEAYLKALVNGERADCLSMIIDRKIDYDIMKGQITDFGNVITDDVCKEWVYTEFQAERANLSKEDRADYESRVKAYIKKKFGV